MPPRKPGKQPSLSNSPGDKIAAAMNWPIGKSRDGTSYAKAPRYFDECWAWYQRLNEEQQDWCTYIVDVYTHWGPQSAKRYAARLPVAPKCPL
jgi:hypothetical protein